MATIELENVKQIERRRVVHPMIDGFTDEHLEVYAGEKGAGSVPHYYQVRNKSGGILCEITLQEGHPGDGINGIGNQTLMLILYDFLTEAQTGEFRCRENAIQITKIEEAMQWSKQREMERKARGVLQTYQK